MKVQDENKNYQAGKHRCNFPGCDATCLSLADLQSHKLFCESYPG
jgi:hypothetical protein